jgi:transcriptional regulator with GAF, ATPase, and Fis domain
VQRIAERYRVLRPLGEGGAGTVVAALDEVTGQEVALKLVSLGTPALARAFHTELGALRGLVHPSLVRLLDVGLVRSAGGLHGFTTAPVIGGTDLATFADGRRWPDVERALDGVLRALHALHRCRVLHGDVTPDNVLVGAHGATLIDLSCAHRMDAPPDAPRGTPGFIAPEWLRGAGGDARSDLYALGRTLELVLARVRGRVPARVVRLVGRLVADHPSERPVDVPEVLDLLELAPASEGPSDAAPTLGREPILAALDRAIDDLVAARASPRALLLEGPPGVGRTRLLDEAKWTAQPRTRTIEAIGPSPLIAALSRLASSRVSDAADVLALVRGLRAPRAEPSVLLVDDVHALSSHERALLTALLSALAPDDPLLVVLTTVASRASAPLDHVEHIVVPPLADDAVHAWLRDRVPATRVEDLVRECQGLPGAVALALRRPIAKRTALDLRELDRAVRDRLAELVASPDRLALDVRDRASLELEARGLARFEADGFRLARREDRAALAEALGERALRRAHARLADRASTPRARILHLLGADRVDEAEALDRTTLDREALEALARRTARYDVALDCVQRLEQLGHADAALRVLAALPRRLGTPPPALYLRAATCQLKRSNPRAALRHLARVRDPALALDVTIERARAHLQRGAYAEAAELARAVLAEHDLPAAHELLGIALGYLGDASADAHLAKAEARASDARAIVRASSYRAIAAYRRGDLEGARAGYERALSVARAHRLLDQLASAALNLATIDHRRARFGTALALYDEARELAAALGMPRAEASVRANLAQLYLELGAFDRSRALAESARRLADRHALSFTAHAAAMIEAEVSLLEGRLDEAEGQLATLRAAFADSPRELAETRLLDARLALARGGDPSDALAEARRSIDLAGATDLEPRLALVEAERDATRDPARALERLERALAQADASELDLVATLEARLARVHAQVGTHHAAEAHAKSALARWDRAAATLAPALREVFAKHPSRAALRDTTIRTASSEAPRGRGLERLLELAGNVARARDPARILELALDAAIELTRAERGFVLLAQDGALEVSAARNVDREDLARSTTKYSRTIAERVLREGEPIVTSEAQDDARFAERRSIHAMRLRSVLCVPVRTDEGVMGALYLDNRFEAGRFGEDDARLLAGFADHVAIALTHARLRADLERRTAELEDERERIAARLDASTREVARLSRRVRDEGGFHGIVGRTPAMRALFATLERLASSSVTVLVQGESGSGKELVARAIHDAGPRVEQPFVSVNCGAIPDSLLESELFGHVRGAFTGADRDRVGLFVQAGEGTLFLDEVGEMPESMQVKLLRALEERKVRAVGSNVAVPFAARIVCATNRELEDEVRRGRFREDLYYRLAVVVVSVPPLRERREDIPFLARALLSRLDDPVELTREAIAKLVAYDWPGNVRQLDNVLRAAAVFAERGRIEAHDLTLPAARSRSDDPEDEEQRIRRALSRHDWNVSEVSRALGIPRMTLYRRLRHYGITRA